MPEVAQLFSGAQIGVESTAGTAVSASKLLRYMSLEPGISINFNRFRPMGQRVASAITPGQDFSEWGVTGAGTYSELIYPLSSIMGTTTASATDTSAFAWVWSPAARTELAAKTYTVESGSSTRAQKATYALFTGLEVTFNRTDGVSLGGAMIAQQLQDNISLTASPTAIEDKPILPTHLDVYVDPTSGTLGTTKLTRDFNAVFRCTDMFGPVWPINSALASFGAHVEIEPTIQMEITVAADSQGMGFLANARLGETRYLRMAAIAPGASYGFAGAATVAYTVMIDMAGKISNINAFDDQDGIKVLTYTFDAVLDTAWATGRYCLVTVYNKVSAL